MCAPVVSSLEELFTNLFIPKFCKYFWKRLLKEAAAYPSLCLLYILPGHMSARHVQIDVFADGVAIKEPGAECFRLLRQYLDGILMVNPFSLAC